MVRGIVSGGFRKVASYCDRWFAGDKSKAQACKVGADRMTQECAKIVVALKKELRKRGK